MIVLLVLKEPKERLRVEKGKSGKNISEKKPNKLCENTSELSESFFELNT